MVSVTDGPSTGLGGSGTATEAMFVRSLIKFMSQLSPKTISMAFNMKNNCKPLIILSIIRRYLEIFVLSGGSVVAVNTLVFELAFVWRCVELLATSGLWTQPELQRCERQLKWNTTAATTSPLYVLPDHNITFTPILSSNATSLIKYYELYTNRFSSLSSLPLPPSLSFSLSLLPLLIASPFRLSSSSVALKIFLFFILKQIFW